MLENINMALKGVKLPETKTARAVYHKYLSKVAESVVTLLLMQGNVGDVLDFINKSLPSVISIGEDKLEDLETKVEEPVSVSKSPDSVAFKRDEEVEHD